MFTSRPSTQRAFTLVEAVIAIVVVSIAITGVLSVFIVTAQHSADPMVQQQAQFIAESYLDEILRQKFFDPDTDIVCTNTSSGETRATYDNVCDYVAISPESPPRNQFGNLIHPTALSGYSVAISVVSSSNPATLKLNTLDNSSVVRVLRVDVTVTGPNGVAITLSGYRTNYNCSAAGDPGCKGL